MTKNLSLKADNKPNYDVFEIKVTVANPLGKKFNLIYREDDPLRNLEGKRIPEVRAFCFYKGKLVVVYEPKKGYWNLPGGKLDPGESYIEATIREVKEEANMKVLSHDLIGYQDNYELEEIVRRHPFSFCVVEPIGNFTADPSGDISEIKLIDPKDYKKYFDWGVIGDRVMDRALQLEKSQ